MGFNILNILSLANVIVFITVILFTRKERNKIFIQYILLSYPFLSNYALPSVNTFVLITLIHLIFFYKKKSSFFSSLKTYTLIVHLFIITAVVGYILNGVKTDRDTFIYITQISSLLIYSKILLDELRSDANFLFRIINCLKITLSVSFFFLLAQYIFGPEVSLSRSMNPNIVSLDTIRYPSFLSDPQVYAQFLGMISFLCLVKTGNQNNKLYSNYILLIIAVIGILVTGARAGLSGLILGVCVIIIFSEPKYRYRLLLISGITYLIAINFKDSLSIFNRRGDLNDTYDFRFSIWLDAIEIFKKHPVFGIGVGNYNKYVSLYHPDQYWLVEDEIVYFDHPESGYLKFLTEFGLLGFVCIALLFFIPIIKGIKNFIFTKNQILILLISGIICWMVGFYSTFSFGDIRIGILVITLLCMLMAINASITEHTNKPNKSAQLSFTHV